MGIRIIDSDETYRLITDGGGRYAVVEARCGHVYSLDCHHAHQAPDGEEGMREVVGEHGWNDYPAARDCFRKAVTGERYYKEHLW